MDGYFCTFDFCRRSEGAWFEMVKCHGCPVTVKIPLTERSLGISTMAKAYKVQALPALSINTRKNLPFQEQNRITKQLEESGILRLTTCHGIYKVRGGATGWKFRAITISIHAKEKDGTTSKYYLWFFLMGRRGVRCH
jgi:hypothetical protein